MNKLIACVVVCTPLVAGLLLVMGMANAAADSDRDLLEQAQQLFKPLPKDRATPEFPVTPASHSGVAVGGSIYAKFGVKQNYWDATSSKDIDKGRIDASKDAADLYVFKVASLRNVAMTPPYFHDGSQETLWDVADHYNKGDGLKNPWLDEDVQPLALTDQDIADLVAFLASLTGAEYKELGTKELARQRALSLTSRPQRDTARAFGPKQPKPKPPSP